MKFFASALAIWIGVFAVGCSSTPTKSARDTPNPPIFVMRHSSPLSTEPDFQIFPEYLAELIRSVDEEWNKTLATSAVYPRAGSEVTIRFTLNSDGVVTRIVEVEETAGKQGTYACLSAIQDPQPYRPWSHEMIDALGHEQTLTFHFFYH